MVIATQAANGTLALRDRIFQVERAKLVRHDGSWRIEIETDGQEFDHENWAPYLCHQGLKLDVADAAGLEGGKVSWLTSRSPGYEHPEIGSMYVFGHHDVRNCEIAFGAVSDGEIELSWTGLCDVFWDDDFRDNVPFTCKCRAAIEDWTRSLGVADRPGADGRQRLRSGR